MNCVLSGISPGGLFSAATGDSTGTALGRLGDVEWARPGRAVRAPEADREVLVEEEEELQPAASKTVEVTASRPSRDLFVRMYDAPVPVSFSCTSSGDVLLARSSPAQRISTILHRNPTGPRRYNPGAMPQGTIKDYDPKTRTGLLLQDDRAEVHIDVSSLEGSGLRYLRIGQRVKFDLAEEGGKKVARTLRHI